MFTVKTFGLFLKEKAPGFVAQSLGWAVWFVTLPSLRASHLTHDQLGMLEKSPTVFSAQSGPRDSLPAKAFIA